MKVVIEKIQKDLLIAQEEIETFRQEKLNGVFFKNFNTLTKNDDPKGIQHLIDSNHFRADKALFYKMLLQSCMKGNIKTVKFLLTNPFFKEVKNIYEGEAKAFRECVDKKHNDIVRYFLLEENIEITPRLKDYVYKSKNSQAIEMVTVLKFAKKLENKLIEKDSIVAPKLKI